MKTSFIQYSLENCTKLLPKINFEFYQHPEFVQLDAELIDGESLAWYAEDGDEWVLIPLIKRRIPDEITNGKEYYDLVSPYGYPGILSSSYRAINRFLKRHKQDAAEHDCLSTFIRLSPIYNPYLLDETDDFVQVVHGKLVMLDMRQPYEEQRMKYSSGHRRQIKKLTNSGYELDWNNWDELDSFLEIYNETMEREDAREYYFFPKNYFTSLKEIVGENNIDLLFVRNEAGEAVSGSIFCRNDYILQYHLSGTKTDYLRKAPSKLLLDEVIKKYSQKIKYFNLGGGVGNEEDSLFKFKKYFGKEYRKFSTLRIVNDRSRYNNLCQQYSKDQLYDLKDYFPLYRSEEE